MLCLPWDIALRNPFLHNKLTMVYIYHLMFHPYCLQVQFLLSLNKQTTKWNCILFVNKCFRSLFLSTTHILFLPLTTVLLFFLQKGRGEKKGFLYEVINLILFHIIYFIIQFTRQGDDCLKLSNCPATGSHEIHCIINSFLTHLVWSTCNWFKNAIKAAFTTLLKKI